eukprot:519581-Rhodomonas_salina.1
MALGMSCTVSGTKLAYAPFRTDATTCLRACYAESGTDVAYAATSTFATALGGSRNFAKTFCTSPPMALRAPYQISGTHLRMS